MNQLKSSSASFEQMEQATTRFFTNLSRPFQELYDGIRSRTLPWQTCFMVGVVFQVAFLFHLDLLFFRYFDLEGIYPGKKPFFQLYYCMSVLSPFWGWALFRSLIKQSFMRRLTCAFQEIGLKNCTGKVPNFVFDRAIDPQTRKLRLSRTGIPPEEFLKKKSAIQSALQVFVDEIREDRTKGTMDIIYGREPMPLEFVPSSYRFKPGRFLIGKTRSEVYFGDLDSTPHLLVAGQTGGGKSTFLRQFITSLYLGNRSYRFSLIDLKGGLEFQTFEKLPRVRVLGSVKESIDLFQHLVEDLENRMRLLKDSHCKDIRQYNDKSGLEKLPRHVVVVDEAAEMFLAGHHAQAQEVQKARRTLSQIARQGRSLGIHLVIATQRPDSKSLDPQVKANLPGVLCFQMVNDASSISVLGTGRATDLPSIAGRGIWKNSADMLEIQTPYLKIEEAEELLKDHLRPGKDLKTKAGASDKTDSGYSRDQKVEE